MSPLRESCSNYTQHIVKNLVSDHQLGLIEGGYEVGIHVMRALVKACRDGDVEMVIFLLDFANAYNSSCRELMLALAEAHVQDMAELCHWLYLRRRTRPRNSQ